MLQAEITDIKSVRHEWLHFAALVDPLCPAVAVAKRPIGTRERQADERPIQQAVISIGGHSALA